MLKKDNKVENLMKFLEAENQAFEAAGIELGEVEFTCPLCGGEAKGDRHMSGSRVKGLGSGCRDCGLWHT